MTGAPLSVLAARYWEASLALRGRRAGPSPATAASYLASQVRQPAHPLIERRCRRALADLGLEGVERLRPTGGEPAA